MQMWNNGSKQAQTIKWLQMVVSSIKMYFLSNNNKNRWNVLLCFSLKQMPKKNWTTSNREPFIQCRYDIFDVSIFHIYDGENGMEIYPSIKHIIYSILDWKMTQFMGNYFRIFEYIHDTRKNANKPNHTYIDRNGEQQTDKQIERNEEKLYMWFRWLQ